MKKTLKIKSIFVNEEEVDIFQINSIKDGIAFILKNEIINEFDLKAALEQKRKKKIIVRTVNGKIYSLFDCYYVIKFIGTNKCVHFIFGEIFKGKVNDINFICNEIKISLDSDNIRKDINFTKRKIINEEKGITIYHNIDRKNMTILVKSDKEITRNELFSYFTIYYEFFNLIIGFFPPIKKIEYKYANEYIVDKSDVVDKYVSDFKYVRRDMCLFSELPNESYNQYVNNYFKLANDIKLHMSVYFIIMMKKNSYIELDTVNILQLLDGIYDKLSIYEDRRIDYCDEMNKKIIKKINKINFDSIKKKYNSNINVNERISNYLTRLNNISYRNKLKRMFEFDNLIIFEHEKNNETGYIKYKNLINKCYNSRNKLSHMSEHEDYLFENENSVYLWKFILLYRLIIIKEIGLYNCIDKRKLEMILANINKYIVKILSNR